MAAMILLCGILTGIGIFLVVLKQEKLPEQKPEKVKQELQKKSEETLEDPKQKPEETEPEKEAEEQAEEPLSMELSGLNEEALSMMGISKREVADALRTWTQEHGFSSATGAQFMEPMLVRFSEEKYSMDCQLLFCRWRQWNPAGGCTNQADDGLFQREKVVADSSMKGNQTARQKEKGYRLNIL